MNRHPYTVTQHRTTKHVMDAQGRWTTAEMHVWRDASGWHEIPARDERVVQAGRVNNRSE